MPCHGAWNTPRVVNSVQLSLQKVSASVTVDFFFRKKVKTFFMMRKSVRFDRNKM